MKGFTRKVFVVIQARMGSSRLPGKALLPLNGETTLYHVIKRALWANYPVILATTNRYRDDFIEAVALQCGVPCFRWDGRESDVLGRFAALSKELKLKDKDIIVRVTADCLGLDFRAIHECVENLKYEYSYASYRNGYPRGYGCEAFTVRLLEEAQANARNDYDREHVTPYMQDKTHWLHRKTWRVDRYDNIPMELNDTEDYLRIKHIYAQFL